MDARLTQLVDAILTQSQAQVVARVRYDVLPDRLPNEDFRTSYFKHCARPTLQAHAEWYRALAYVNYGYGSWSNNDRRHNGLPALRKRRKRG